MDNVVQFPVNKCSRLNCDNDAKHKYKLYDGDSGEEIKGFKYFCDNCNPELNNA